MPAFTLDQNTHSVTLTTDAIELVFSRDDGGLRVLRRLNGPNMLGYGQPRAAVDVQVGADETWLAERVLVRYLGHHVQEHATAVEIAIRIGMSSLIIVDHYRITGTLIARHVSVMNVSDDAVQQHRLRLLLPWVCSGQPETCRFEAPGSTFDAHLPLAALPLEQEAAPFEPAPAWSAGLLAVHNTQIHEALLCWYHSTTEPAQPVVQSNGRALSLIHDLALAGMLHTDTALHGGTQYILLLPANWADAVASFRRTLAVIGTPSIQPPLAWINGGSAVYEVDATEYGGFAGLATQTALLQANGITALCLLPIWQTAGNSHAISDFEQLDPRCGTADELRALVAAAHTRGMRVMVELPLSVYAAESRYVSEHPEWFCQPASGELPPASGRDAVAYVDWANHDARAYAVWQANQQAQQYDLDGYRIIARRTTTPNWSPERSVHASAGTLGMLQVAEQVRQAMRGWKHDAVVFAPWAGPAVAAFVDVVLDERAHEQFYKLVLRRTSPADFAAWLDLATSATFGSTPRGCFVESVHTTHQTPLASGLRGSPLSRAWLACVVLCGFVPLVTREQIAADAPFVQLLLHARAQHQALFEAGVACQRVPCSSAGVLAMVRTAANQTLLGVVNLGPLRHTITLQVPLGTLHPARRYHIADALRAEQWNVQDCDTWTPDQLANLELSLEPFGVVLLVVQPAA